MSSGSGARVYFAQALRAIAAALVVVDHALLQLSNNDPDRALTHLGWTLGSIGVDTFFVISGFIMVHVSWSEFGTPGASRRFLVRRAIRILPLYWIGTLAAFAYHRISNTHGMGDGLRELAWSLLFVPYPNGDGSWNPILPQGWTLIYEVLFYVVFAMFLSCGRRVGILLVSAGMLALVAVRPLVASPEVLYLGDPIILLFVAGMGLGAVWQRWRVYEPDVLRRMSKPFERYGDASYAVYLIQGFVLTGDARIWTASFGELSFALVPISLVATIAAGRVVHSLVERPLLNLLSGHRPFASLGRQRPSKGEAYASGLPPS